MALLILGVCVGAAGTAAWFLLRMAFRELEAVFYLPGEEDE